MSLWQTTVITKYMIKSSKRRKAYKLGLFISCY